MFMLGVVAALGAVVGTAAGAAARWWLARLARGTVLRAGPAEVGGAAVTAVGVAVCWGTPQLGAVLLLGWLGVLLVPVDLRHHRLPDAITLPAIAVSAAVVGLTAWWAPGSGDIGRAALTAVVVWAIFAATARISPRSMGWGDVKLVPSIGLLAGYLSVQTAVLAVALSFVTAAVVAIAGIAAGRWTAKDALPFGPFLLLGGWLAVLLA
ncbi:prepilin peptidase [Nakamurella sp. YIM 132087]|uniref:Prepilin peptidase n=2 Tax=Nakamurella alba TaxID=2665158 RepID=A0A7K1FT92_9ACTN|nr:prepilin peptidase [Nakamurella alba]